MEIGIVVGRELILEDFLLWDIVVVMKELILKNFYY